MTPLEFDEQITKPLAIACDALLLKIIKNISHNDYVETAADGQRLQETMRFIIARGRHGNITSGHLAIIVAKAIAEFMSESYAYTETWTVKPGTKS